MTYRGRMDRGVVVMDGERPADGTVVEVTPVEPFQPAHGVLPGHPALGIWKNRSDLPEDSAEASKVLRRKLMRRNNE